MLYALVAPSGLLPTIGRDPTRPAAGNETDEGGTGPPTRATDPTDPPRRTADRRNESTKNGAAPAPGRPPDGRPIRFFFFVCRVVGRTYVRTVRTYLDTYQYTAEMRTGQQNRQIEQLRPTDRPAGLDCGRNK